VLVVAASRCRGVFVVRAGVSAGGAGSRMIVRRARRVVGRVDHSAVVSASVVRVTARVVMMVGVVVVRRVRGIAVVVLVAARVGEDRRVCVVRVLVPVVGIMRMVPRALSDRELSWSSGRVADVGADARDGAQGEDERGGGVDHRSHRVSAGRARARFDRFG
jgi:hypothetical protein